MMKMKISVWQLICLAFTFQIGLSLLLSENPAIQIAKQDAWISVLLAGLFAAVIALISVRLSLLYPDQTLIQFSQTILGKWPGKIIVIPYFITWFITIGMLLRQFSDFVHVTMFMRTPLWALILPFVLLVVYASQKGGIEVIARCSEIIAPMVVVVYLSLIVLNWPNMRLENLLPVYADSGMGVILRGSLPIVSFFGEVVLMTMTIPFLAKPDKALLGIAVAGTCSVLFVLTSIGIVLMTFGPDLAARMLYPAYEVVRYISAMEFIQNIDVAVVLVWFCLYFVKLASYFFYTTYGLAEWLGFRDWKKSIWFVALVVTCISMWPRHYSFATTSFMNEFWIPYVLPIDMIGIPLFLWIVGMIRQRTNLGIK